MSEETADKALEEEIEQIATEAKGDYDLAARLRGRSMRTKTVTLFTDEPTAEKHQELESKIKLLRASVENMEIIREAAVSIELPQVAKAIQKIIDDALKNDDGYNAEKVAELEAERDELAEELKKTAFVFNLRAVPPIIAKDARRQAKKKLGITGKNVPEAEDEFFEEYVAAYTLAAVVEQYTDKVDGSVHKSLSADDARYLNDLLPDGEYKKLLTALGEVQFKNVISDTVVDSANFSPAI